MNRCETLHPGITENPGLLEGFYNLTDQQRASMSEDAQVALAIVEIGLEKEVLVARGFTQAIVTRTGLDEETVKKANRSLLRQEFLDREGFAEPGSNKALQLTLNTEGYGFLDEAVQHVLNSDT